MRFARFTLAVVTPIAIAIAAIAGCSDPVPVTPQGAWTVNFTSSDSSKCKIASHQEKVGVIGATAKDNRTLTNNGPEGAKVVCKVSGAGPFYVEGSVNLEEDGLEIVVGSLPVSATEASPAKGSVSFVSGKTVSGYTSGTCDFFFEPGGVRVLPGRVWVSFRCPDLTDASSNSSCSLDKSTMLLENCQQE